MENSGHYLLKRKLKSSTDLLHFLLMNELSILLIFVLSGQLVYVVMWKDDTFKSLLIKNCIRCWLLLFFYSHSKYCGNVLL